MQGAGLSMVSGIHLEHIPLWIMGILYFLNMSALTCFYIRLQHSHTFASQNRLYQGARF